MKTEASDPTCTDTGNREYYTCKVCGQYFADAAATQPLQQKELVLPATGHNYQSGKCTLCGAIDPDYKPVEPPNTEDSSATALWTAWLAMAGAVLGMACRSRAKKY